jgi:microcystin degradation protein MlrC
MRLFAASLATETNTFSPIPTSRANFEASAYFPAGQHPDRPTHTTAPLYVARQRAKRDGFTLIEGSCFWAEPSGTCAMADYEEMRDEILGQLKAALPVDGVLLGLHGAMVAHGYDDCEGDILEHVRALVGSQVPIGVELDPHCHLTEKRVRLANAIILYKEYPHIDFVERAEELVTIIVRTIRGEIRPVMSLYDCRMIELVPTTREPGRSFVDRMSALEGKENLLSVSLAHDFQQGDVPEIGSRVLVITDDAKAAGDALATRLGEEFRALKGQFAPPVVPLDQALDQALASTGNRPSVIADSTDNAGGGAASDNTNIIHRLRERGIRDVAIGPVWDPVAVGFCLTAGVGSTIPLRFGGKAAATSGTPVDGEVTVLGSVRNGTQSFGTAKVPIGDAVGIRIDGIDVALLSHRTQALGLEIFTSVGIDPTQKRIVSVKSTNHFHAAYGPIASAVIYTDGGGPSHLDVRKYPYRKIARPLWPHSPLPPGRMVV